MRKKIVRHPPEKIDRAWEMRMDRYSAKHISRAIKVPVDTLNDWFYFRTQVRLNMLASAKVGWRSWKLRNAQEHCA